jgi:6-phosphogluconolactonase
VRIERHPTEQLAAAAAAHVAARLRDAVAARGRATLAVSGGSTPTRMFEALAAADADVPWERVHLFQVDERVAPFGHRDRNLTDLVAHLLCHGRVPAGNVHAMPVATADPAGAAARYASELPDAFDVIHLGIGDDGHTASLVPGDPVREVRDRPVAFSRPYQGRMRMTLTYPVLDRAREVVWLVSGTSKAAALAGALRGDPALPASHVSAVDAVVFADDEALSAAPPGL